YPFEAEELFQRPDDARLICADVELHDLISCSIAVIRYIDMDLYGAVRRDAILFDSEIAVGELRIAQAVAERVENVAVEVLVSPLALDDVVIHKVRQLIDGAVPSEV